MTKQCSKCKEVKDVSEFSKDRTKKDGLQAPCKECASAIKRAYYTEHPEKRKAYNTAYYWANPEGERARKIAYYTANADRLRAAARASYLEDPSKQLAYNAAYQKANPDKMCAKTARRRARKVGASISYLPANYRTILFNFYGNKCMMPGCDKEITKRNPLTEDHIIPLAKGGPHTFYNLQVLCKSCNSSKRDYSTDDYRNGRVLLGAHDPKFNLWDYMKEHKSVTIKR